MFAVSDSLHELEFHLKAVRANLKNVMTLRFVDDQVKFVFAMVKSLRSL